jgi:hypothetical protein
MSFDAWIVAFGLSRLLQELQIVRSAAAYLVLVAIGLLDMVLLYRFFSIHERRLRDAEALEAQRRFHALPSREVANQ